MHLITLQAKAVQRTRAHTRVHTRARAHTHTSFLGTQINTKALQKSNEEEDIGERNRLHTVNVSSSNGKNKSFIE